MTKKEAEEVVAISGVEGAILVPVAVVPVTLITPPPKYQPV